MRTLSILILFAMATGCAGGMVSTKKASIEKSMQEHSFTQHYDNSIFKIAQKSLYSVELLVKDGTLFVGRNAMDIIVHDRDDRDITGAKITITPWMPSMGHGVPDVPVITERGGGRYTADMVHISMPGLWELQVEVDASSGTDTAIFEFPDVQLREGMEQEGMGHPHSMEGMSHEGMTGMDIEEKVDYSNTMISQKGLFKVSYETEHERIPIRSIHEWRLNIIDMDGNPVDGADIEVSGLMPAHGHGMPTIPEVTPEGGGQYHIEGMAFSMPGHWTVNIKINKNGMKDSATFNLNLR